MDEPNLIHYLPVATTAMSVAFLAVLARRAAPRGWPPHLTWWAAGVFFYGLGTLLESWIAIGGNTELLNRLWYWAGAILGGYPLATGSVYLLARRRTAHILTALSGSVVLLATVCVLLTPIDISGLPDHKPSGAALGWSWVRLLTPFINGYAALFLIGGAVLSSARFLRGGDDPGRAKGTALIAFGALLPGIGGGMAKAGMVEALYLGEFVGLALIWWGYELCVRAPHPVATAPGRKAEPATVR